MAWADVQGDGIEEVYVSGSFTHPGALHQRGADGAYRSVAGTGLPTVGGEAGALFFEAGGDGQPDLLIIKSPAGVALCHNQGQSRFALAPPGTLPPLTNAWRVASAADVDRDGDLDLFLGGGTIPGRYPLPADSHLWRNDGGGPRCHR